MFLQETPAELVAVGSEVLVLPYPPAVKDGMRRTNAFGAGRKGRNDWFAKEWIQLMSIEYMYYVS